MACQRELLLFRTGARAWGVGRRSGLQSFWAGLLVVWADRRAHAIVQAARRVEAEAGNAGGASAGLVRSDCAG